MERIYCQICKCETNQLEVGKFTKHHLLAKHNITSKEYYNTYLKKDDEGMCLTCGKETRFISIKKGYTRFCDNSCVLKNKSIQEISQQHSKNTKLERYGDENYCNKEKIKETKLERYGDENYCNIEKCKKTKLEKYGDENYCNKEKIKETKLEKYGDENYNNIEKYKQTMLGKYNVINSFQIKEIIYQIQQIRNDKKEEIYEKIKQSNIKKYGDYYFKSKAFRDLMESTGKLIPLSKKSAFEKYQMTVKNETNKWKKILFEEWDGLDYYTGEELITNKKEYNHRLYRTIDHKISIFYGFKNNIEPDVIGNILNLCVCSRHNNSKKNKNIFLKGV